MDPESLRGVITKRTRAIMPVHLFGLCAEMDPIIEAASSAGVPVVEDACQAIGARYNGRQAGSMGIAGCFSFFPSKNLGAFGDGGLVTTNDAGLAREVRLLRNHGAEPKYFHKRVGGNFRLDALQAAVLRVKLPHLARWTEKRRENARRYAGLFRGARLLDRVRLPLEPPGLTHIFNQYVIQVPNRDAVRERLAQAGIGTEVYYPVPFHRQECFASLGHRNDLFPNADRAASSSLALPIYAELTLDQQSAVVDALSSALVA
jgi:dTDP-4-amino-4,6-dideoxygalactose transaminase